MAKKTVPAKQSLSLVPAKVEIATRRLTNFDREGVARRAIKSSFEAKEKELAAQEDKLARDAYAILVPAAVLKHAKAMPEGWMQTSSVVRVNAGGSHVELHLIGDELPMPAKVLEYRSRLGIISDEAFVNRAREHLAATETMKADKKKADASLNAMLASINTLRTLYDVWPDGAAFYEHLNTAVEHPLPAPMVKEINTMLGLPRDQLAA